MDSSKTNWRVSTGEVIEELVSRLPHKPIWHSKTQCQLFKDQLECSVVYTLIYHTLLFNWPLVQLKINWNILKPTHWSISLFFQFNRENTQWPKVRGDNHQTLASSTPQYISNYIMSSMLIANPGWKDSRSQLLHVFDLMRHLKSEPCFLL
jgi:hypothetical protein